MCVRVLCVRSRVHGSRCVSVVLTKGGGDARRTRWTVCVGLGLRGAPIQVGYRVPEKPRVTLSGTQTNTTEPYIWRAGSRSRRSPLRLSLSLNTLLLSSSSLPSAVARVPGRSTGLSESQAPPTQTVVKLLDRPPFWRRAVTEVASLRPRGFEPRWRRSGAIKAFLKPQFPSGFFNG